MGSAVTLQELPGEVALLCREYAAEVEQQLRADIDAAAEVALQEVRAASPRSGARRRHYADGWELAEDSDGLRGYGVRLYNTAKPGLTHLLEKGHGGPHPAAAIPHIAPAAEAARAELGRRLSRG